MRTKQHFFSARQFLYGTTLASILLFALFAGKPLTAHAQGSDPLTLTATSTLGTFVDCASQTEIPIIECDALVALYSGTNGANWTDNTGWLNNDMPCSWYGVGCDTGSVSQIFLGNNNLIGGLPVEIGNLSNLISLGLFQNQLSGNIPVEITNLTNLKNLYLWSNQLTGTIPAQIGNLSNLEIIALGGNYLNGGIPSGFGNLSKLTSLQIQFNNFSGAIPPEIFNLPNLHALYLNGNQLSGNLPDEIGNLASLQDLSISNNLLSGDFPATITNLYNLQSLSFDLCSITSSDPIVIAFIANLVPGWQGHCTDPVVTVSTLLVLGMQPNTSKYVSYQFTETAGGSGYFNIFTYRFYLQDGTPLGSITGPISLGYPISIQPNGYNSFAYPIYLPASVADEARVAGQYAIVLKASFQGKATGDASIAAEASTLVVLSPAPFSKVGPANGSTKQPSSLTLSWNGSLGNYNFEYCVDTINNNRCDTGWIGTYNTSKLVTGLLPNTTYYWQVRALNYIGERTNANDGVWWHFTTLPNLPGAFNKSSPINKVTGQPVNIVLHWGSSANATSYEFCYDTTNDNNCSLWISNNSVTNVGFRVSPNTTYYWHVRAVNDAGVTYANGSSTAFWSFKTSPLPGAFSKIAPANNAQKQSVTPVLTWGASSGATSYEYCYDTINNTSCDTAWNSTAGKSVTLSGLSNNLTYYWQVRAIGPGGVTFANATAWWNFKVVITPPVSFVPGNIVPGAAINVLTRRPTFTWNPVTGATGYTVEVSTTQTFLSKAINATTSATSYIHTADLTANTIYFWRVKANGVNGPSLYSQVRTFRTGNPPSVPSLSVPAANALVTSTTPLLDWSNSTLPAGSTAFHRYEVQTASNSTFTVDVTIINVPGAVTDSQVTAPTLLNGFTYYWRVRSVNVGADGIGGNADDHFSSWSLSRSLRVPFAAPVLTLPLNEATGVPLKPAFTWIAIPGATSYTLQVSTSNTFRTLIINKTINVPATGYTHTLNLKSNTIYYWHVRANGAYGPGMWSTTFSFTTQ
jgi:hypothetical protein